MAQDWLINRREHLRLSQDDIAAALQREGFNFTRATISHWEMGRHNPPFNDPEFTRVLASVLKMTVLEVLQELGYKLAPVGLNASEIHVIEAIRQGDKFEAIKTIVEI